MERLRNEHRVMSNKQEGVESDRQEGQNQNQNQNPQQGGGGSDHIVPADVKSNHETDIGSKSAFMRPLERLRLDSASFAVQYKQCVKNVNADRGGPEAHDGCREFAPTGKDGTAEALTCSACGCHRNFHQQVLDDTRLHQYYQFPPATSETSLEMEKVASDILQLVKKTKRKDCVQGEQILGEILEHLAKIMLLLRPPAPPPSRPVKQQPNLEKPSAGVVIEPGDAIVLATRQPNPSSPDRSVAHQGPKEKKRKRTKFSSEQRSKLEELARSVQWALGSLSKEQQERAALEIGIPMDSLKYWFHNTKQKKKHEDGGNT